MVLASGRMSCRDVEHIHKVFLVIRETKTPKIQENSMSDPGAMLAFSWACNQAVSNDSVIKCPFCDTPFISKGAYRHHLSKMHFTKESTATGSSNVALPANVRTPSPDAKEDETLQSKYHKYAQLAKQLSCNHKWRVLLWWHPLSASSKQNCYCKRQLSRNPKWKLLLEASNSW